MATPAYNEDMAERVCIVGGGLAGLATAATLAPRGFQVTLLEARPRLGGRAGSFQDGPGGPLLDACQHVGMGCCTNLAHFFRTLGVAHLLQTHKTLYFLTPDRRVSVLQADPLPAPLHLLRSFLGVHYLTGWEKARIAWGLACLRLASENADPPFAEWLRRHGQTPRTVERFWGLVLVSALNESPERMGLKYARKVFLDGFLRHRQGFEVEIPSVPLGRLYGEETSAWLKSHGIKVCLGTGVRRFLIEHDRVAELETRDGQRLQADWYVSAVPFDRLLGLLPGEVVQRHACFANLANLETAPITSVHLWYEEPIMSLPHAVLIGCVGQWLFDRGPSAEGHYLQVVVSASRQFRGLSHAEVRDVVTRELAALFPRAKPERLRRARVVTERAATFSVVPGVDRWRPAQHTPIANLFLAGDWTATGWPATMEGAVRSGYLAAEALLHRVGRPQSLLQPDLGEPASIKNSSR
jgi:squalene-associated FAD-dependent desaturase